MCVEMKTVLVNCCNSHGSYSVARAQSTTVVMGRIPYYLRHRKKELPRNLHAGVCTVLGVEHAICVHVKHWRCIVDTAQPDCQLLSSVI
jgi:hypothetical protein